MNFVDLQGMTGVPGFTGSDGIPVSLFSLAYGELYLNLCGMRRVPGFTLVLT